LKGLTVKTRSLLIVVVGVFLLFGTEAQAQTGANDVFVGQSFQVAAHQADPSNVTEYRLYRVLGTAAPVLVSAVPASARNATTGEFVFPARTESAVAAAVVYQVASANVNASGEAESTRALLTIRVWPAAPTAPSAPSLPKIIKLAVQP
jgi:hypothetical protein